MILLNADIDWEQMNVPDFHSDKYKFKYGNAYGIGYYSKPFSRSRKNNDKDESWQAWNKILKDVSEGKATICDEWKEFYCFRDWYKAHNYTIEGDRIFLTTKVFSDSFHYSPETCVFASRRITQFIIPDIYGNPQYDKDGVELPVGMTWRQDNPKWQGYYNISVGQYKKSYKNREEALQNLQRLKNDGAKQLAEEYKEYITEKLYNHLKNEYEWKPIYRSEKH